MRGALRPAHPCTPLRVAVFGGRSGTPATRSDGSSETGARTSRPSERTDDSASQGWHPLPLLRQSRRPRLRHQRHQRPLLVLFLHRRLLRRTEGSIRLPTSSSPLLPQRQSRGWKAALPRRGRPSGRPWQRSAARPDETRGATRAATGFIVTSATRARTSGAHFEEHAPCRRGRAGRARRESSSRPARGRRRRLQARTKAKEEGRRIRACHGSWARFLVERASRSSWDHAPR